MFRPFLRFRSKPTLVANNQIGNVVGLHSRFARRAVNSRLSCNSNKQRPVTSGRIKADGALTQRAEITLRKQRNGSRNLQTKPETWDGVRGIRKVADRFGARLTKDELASLRKQLDRDGDGLAYRAELWQQSQKVLEERTGREICLSVICQPKSKLDQLGSNAAVFCDYLGTFMFAAVGTQVAGDAGMNIVGCTLVGCVAAMGGGTVNGILYGANAPIYGRPGVRWVKDPSFLIVAIVTSIATFIAWPYYCQSTSDHYLRNVIGEENLEEDGSVGKDAFVAACKRDKEFLKIVRAALPETSEADKDPAVLFHHVDIDHSGFIDDAELKILVQKRFNNSFETFTMDTLALAGLGVAAVHGAIRAGLHPLVAATSGVTICFGGILRDVLCGRDLALGGQSYALATATGSTMHVLLREVCIRGFQIPLVVRIFLSASTIIGMRALEYSLGKPLLAPMHGENQLFKEDFFERKNQKDALDKFVSMMN